MKAILCTLALLPLALAGVGCKKSPSLIGKWNVTVKEMTGTFEFLPEDKMVLSVNTPGGIINLVGECKLKGEEATLAFTDVKVPGQTDANAALIKSALKAELNKPQVFRVMFVSDDEVSFAEKEKPAPPAPATPPPTDGASADGEPKPDGTTPEKAPVKPPAPKPIPPAMTLKRIKEGS
jgi:hypothetical protein